MLRSEIMCWCQGIVKMEMDEVVRAFKTSGQLHLTTWTLDATPLAHIYSHRSLLNLKFILHTAYNSNKYNSSTYGAMCDPIRDDGSSKSRAVSKEKRPYVYRYWSWADIIRAFTVAIVHFLCLLAPFNYKWEALRFGLVLYALNALSITFSYHRNLAHRSFKLPKWLEYPCAYFAVFALQGDPLDWVSIHRFHHQFTDSDRDPHSPMEGFWFSHVWWICDTHYIKYKCGGRNNVMDLKKQWFYWFLRMTIGFHVLMFWTVLYLYGGLPYLTCGGGVGGVIGYHVTWLVNSACHIWGSRSWKTKDTSRNIWWLSLFTMGESWHNNHHAFESSARQGLEWWQIDITWYLIRLLEVLGLATDVKLPSEFQKQKMALAR